MQHDKAENVRALRERLRREAHRRRRLQGDKEAVSRAACARLAALPEYARAETLMLYVDVRDELRTRNLLDAELSHRQRRVVVPCCVGDALELFVLESTDELAPGTLGILEPRRDLRGRDGKRIALGEVDLVVVPGVAFDRRGGRLGHGRGYYDRLLAQAGPDIALVGLAYECQLFPEIPTQPHDVPMDNVVTEAAVYACGPKRGRE